MTELANKDLEIPSPNAWRNPLSSPSLPDVYRTVPVNSTSFFKKIIAFSGPGYLIAVGYMDPGNWATDISGGSQFGYTLLSVILISNIFAIFLQTLALKLGIATGRDLAQACRDHYSFTTTCFLWFFCEIAIIACDLAEVLGSAVALKLLFGIPLLFGVFITTLDIIILLMMQNYGFRLIEAFVITLTIIITGCFAYEIFISQPLWKEAISGFIPRTEILKNRDLLYSAIAILGATIMPHNLYLHSSIVQTRNFSLTKTARKEAIRFSMIDTIIALILAFLINISILILGAATFHRHDLMVFDISEAYKLLSPVLGVSLASTVFATALLVAGQNSALTCTLAGQIVMEGFLKLRLKPYVIRIITRSIAILPAILVIMIAGENKVMSLLIFSQVLLSFQLPFAIIPLIKFTSEKAKMGTLVNSKKVTILAWIITTIILIFNLKLVWLLISSIIS